MYINKVDKLIDIIIDDFYNYIIKKNKIFSKIINESNFVKYQLEINKILSNYVNNINTEQIKNIVTGDNNFLKIISIIKRYLAYYLFLTIGFNQSSKKDTFVNNIIEFTKNQGTFNYKIDNFFNSENNSILIKFHQIVKNSVTILELDSSKLQIVKKKDEYKDAINFLNDLGEDFVIKNFKLDNIKSADKNLQGHNIIKTLIVNNLYIKKEKKDVYDILFSIEKQKGEYTIIDIIVPRDFYIDYSAVEDILSHDEKRTGLSSEIFNYIQENESILKKQKKTMDSKFSDLIKNKIVVPVVDDFLLYHKETEKYENISVNNEPKKKEDTKIKYIVNKIDSVSEYYSDKIMENNELKKNIEKYFYIPLSNRKAILINNTEDIKIINKIINQGKKSSNNEYFNDLLKYREYSYQNFKNFKNYGFSYNSNKTDTIVRFTSFENKRKVNENIQTRVATKDNNINVVGLLIPDKSQEIECLKIGNIKNIRTINKNKDNGYSLTLSYLKKILPKNIKSNIPMYWKFDSSKDKAPMDYYQEVKKNNNQNIQITVSKLYDDLIYFIYSSILEEYEKKKSVDLYTGKKIIEKYEKMFFKLKNNKEINNLLNKKLYYENSTKTEKKYDKRDDYYSGLFEDTISLPYYEDNKNDDYNKIIVEHDYIIEDEDEKEITDAEKVGAICQHFLSWDNLNALRKKNPNKYSYLLYEFINQYVLENNEGDYVCKSCSTQLNIKKFISGGYYDKSSDKFTTYTMPLIVYLEEIPEYEKYRITIRNLDKLVEKISSISNIPYYIGSKSSVKTRRRPIVKNIIDILLKHNKILNKYYKQRQERIEKQYGISKNLSNLFVFELDNSIFMYSSKDKDYYKPIKQNNILIYTLFMIIIELNESQILFMNGDKTCNFYWFEKYGHYYFDNLKIIINDKGDIKPIKNYPILCYILFYTSCLITKYKLWFFESKDNTLSKKKLIPLINRAIINTFVDIANSLLEVNNKEKKDFLYTLMSNRFFLSLNTTFKNRDLLKKLRKIDENKISTIIHKRKYTTDKISTILLPDKFKNQKLKIKKYNVNEYVRYQSSDIREEFITIIKYNNLTNCLDGKFHKWFVKDKTLYCDRCGRNIDSITESNNEQKIIKDNLQIIRLKKLAQKFCSSGEIHKFIYDLKKDKNICVRCDYDSTKNLTFNELQTLEKKIKSKQESVFKNIKSINFNIKTFTNIEVIKKELKKGGLDNILHKFIDIIQSNIGQNIILDNNKISLEKDTYIINHTPKGQLLDNPITITDSSKIIYKKNHVFFKKDVLYYTNLRNAKTDVFYDASTHVLLGYKEINKEYIIIKDSTRYLKIQDSIINRIKLLGYTNKYIPIQKKIKKIKEKYSDKTIQDIGKEIVSNISRMRILILKKIITDFQRYIYRIIYNYEEIEQKYDDENIRDNFMKKYYKKLTKIRIKNENGKNKIFNEWENINKGVFHFLSDDEKININIEDKTISTEELIRIDDQGNIILYYIIQELIKMLNYNPSKFIRANIVYFMLDSLNNTFKFYNKDLIFKNSEVRRFSYILSTDKFIHDTQEQYRVSKPEGFYGEYTDIEDDINPEKEEELYDNKQEMDAIDIETPSHAVSSIDDSKMILDPDNYEPE